MKDNDRQEEDEAQKGGTEDGVVEERFCLALILSIHSTRVLQQVQDLPDGLVSLTHPLCESLIWLRLDICVHNVNVLLLSCVNVVVSMLLLWLAPLTDWTEHWASLGPEPEPA